MVEDIRLDIFVSVPLGRVGEAVNLYRQTLRRRVELAHKQRHVFGNMAVGAQIFDNIGAEGTDIGDAAGVDLVTPGFLDRGIPFA